jgi:hypothetical protein
MGLVDEEDDRDLGGLHLVDHALEPLLELALHAGAGLHQPDVEHAHGDVLQHRRHVALGDAQREALDHRGLADAGLAGEDRVVLAAAHQHVDDLADLGVAADHRVDLALAGAGGQVGGVFAERGIAAGAAAGRLLGGGLGRGPCPALDRAGEHVVEPGDDAVGIDLVELAADLGEQALEHRHLEAGEQHIGRADLVGAEFERAEAPGLLDRVEDVVGEFLDRGRAIGQPVDRAGQIGHEAAAVDPGFGENQLEVGAVGERELLDEMHELHIGVAAQLGAVGRGAEGAQADGVELADEFLALETLG